MEGHDDLYDTIVKKVALQKGRLSKREYRKNKLDLLLRIAKRVDDYSSGCDECRNFRGEIKKFTEDLDDLLSSRKKRNGYFMMIELITKHLQKSHKLITEGKNIKTWMIIGLLIGGFVLGTIFRAAGMSMGFSNGLLIGLVFGGVIGSILDAMAKKRGKVI